MKIKLQILMAAIAVLAVYVSAVQAQANVTFSGGNGTPLSITLQQPVTYTINNSNCSSPPLIFVFDEAGNPFTGTQPPITGTITYSVNGGAPLPFTFTGSGVTVGTVTTNDIYFFNNIAINGPASGATVVLSAGTVTTTTNVAAAPPASGSFTTFITNNTGAQCSANGVVAPPTAASVSISGRVLTTGSRGLANAQVYLTDLQGNTYMARTNSFGYYRFNGIAAGQSVTITIVSKRYQFAPQVVNVAEEINDLNFAAFDVRGKK